MFSFFRDGGGKDEARTVVVGSSFFKKQLKNPT